MLLKTMSSPPEPSLSGNHCNHSLAYRPDTNRIKPVSQGKTTGQKPIFIRVYIVFSFIPTRSCQKFSK